MASLDATDAEPAERPGNLRRSTRADIQSLDNLPVSQTGFVGRSMELAELAELLAASDCRLLTIIGPGGIGKTRLALEAAESAQEMFADGVAFVPLQPVNMTESIVLAVAEAIGCILKGQGDAREQIARFLRPLDLLLVIDNFEHLIGEAPWMGELLAAAPNLRLLVTSREALNLREEWRYPLAGLAAPSEEADDLGQFEAAQLFIERARRVRRDFSPEVERAGIIRLCRITQGVPLALELAAVWVNTLSCAAIADEIEHNATFLATDLRNIPARHRSMRATFDYSWMLLSDDERYVFQRLAVFRGGFDRHAAERVADATLSILSSLVDKSLVCREADGRFHLHELLRQYAEERMRAIPDEAARTYAAHRGFFLAFLADRFEPITGGAQLQATVEIAAEVDNIRAAWWTGVAASEVVMLGRAAHTLTLFHEFRARYREGLAMLDESLRALRSSATSPHASQVLAATLVDVARLNYRLLRLPEMRAALAESEEIYARSASPLPSGIMTDPRLWRAILALVDGRYADADRLGAEVIRRATVDDRPGNISPAWWVRAAASLWQENTDAADEFARRSAEAALTVGDRWHLAYCYNLQGHIAVAYADYEGARRYYEDAYGIREEFGDPEGMAGALGHLAKIAARQGERAEAEQLYRRSLAIARDIGDLGMQIQLLNGLGVAVCAAGEYVAAGHHFAEGLSLAIEARYMRSLLALLVSTAEWLLQIGRPIDAVAPLVIAQTHSASDHETRSRVPQLLTATAAVLSPSAYDAAIERSRGMDPAELAARLVPILRAPLPTVLPSSPPTVPTQPGTTYAGLTSREIDVLRHLVQGSSDREIADELFISPRTVNRHVASILGKLGVGSRTAAAVLAIRERLV